MAKPDRRRGDNREIAKINAEIVKDEKHSAHRRMKLQSVCTHTSSPQHPNVTPKNLNNGKRVWICRHCQRQMDMSMVTEEQLKAAIETVCNVCDFIKISSTGSDKDNKLNETVISEVEYKLMAFMMDAFKAAKKQSAKGAKSDRAYGGGGGRSTWSE